ncbi:hypothetical protein PF010_g33111, partial [Phytophthora fragariae]
YTFTTLVEKVVGTTDKLAVAVGSPSGDYRSLSSLAKRSYDSDTFKSLVEMVDGTTDKLVEAVRSPSESIRPLSGII